MKVGYEQSTGFLLTFRHQQSRLSIEHPPTRRSNSRLLCKDLILALLETQLQTKLNIASRSRSRDSEAGSRSRQTRYPVVRAIERIKHVCLEAKFKSL